MTEESSVKYTKLLSPKREVRPTKLQLNSLSVPEDLHEAKKRTTWYAGQEDNLHPSTSSPLDKRRSDDLVSLQSSSQPPKKTLASKFTKSDPQLSMRVKEPGVLGARSNSPTSSSASGFIRLKGNFGKSPNTSILRRSEKATSMYGESPLSNKKLRPRSGLFTSTIMRRPRNSFSNTPISLMETLDNKKIRSAFNDFLDSEYSSENLCFWSSCEKFRKIKSSEQRLREGKCIYSQYISPNAPHQINIDYITRRQVTLLFTSGESICSDVFDDAQKYVFSIMENDSFPRFVNSNFYKEATVKKNAFESVLGSILPSNKNTTGATSPSKQTNKLKNNSNINNNNNNNRFNASYEASPQKNSTITRRFSFGFKKTHSTKIERNSLPDLKPTDLYLPLQVKVA